MGKNSKILALGYSKKMMIGPPLDLWCASLKLTTID